jgi:hypothetical protein
MAWGKTIWVQPYAVFDSKDRSGSQNPWMECSIISPATSACSVRIKASTYSWSSGYTPWVRLYVGYSKNEPRSSSCQLDMSFIKDFRYSCEGHLDDTYSYVKVQYDIYWPNRGWMTLGHGDAETCRTNGCRDLDLAREPWACQPAPALSKPR